MTHLALKNHIFSITRTIVWVVFLILGLPLLIAILVYLVAAVLGLDSESLNQLLSTNTTKFVHITSYFILTCYCINLLVKHSGFKSSFTFLAIKPINLSLLIKLLAIGVLYYHGQELVMDLISFQTPESMLEMKEKTKTSFDLAILILGSCIISPIVEEIVFRGFAFARLIKTKLGVSGTIAITGILFASLHFKYDLSAIIFITIHGLLLGFVRYKTGNVIYCMALHILNNSLAIAYLLSN